MTTNSEKPKKNLFEKIADFVSTTEEVPVEQTKSESAPEKTAEVTTQKNTGPVIIDSLPSTGGSVVAPPTSFSQPIVVGNGVLDNEAYSKIWARITANDQEGFDYLEFKKTISGLNNVAGLTIAMKYQTAFNMLSGLGTITKEAILSSIEVYNRVVEESASEFSQLVENAYQEKVTSRIEEANRKQAEIEELNKKIIQLQQEVGELTNSANLEASKLDNARKNFSYTAESIKQELAVEKSNIETLVTNQTNS